MITRLKVDGYESLCGVELTDLGGVNVFWGANASGKSNLLDALDLLGHLARAESVLQAFQRHRGSRGERPLPVRRYFALSATTAHDLRFEVDLELPEARVKAVNDELEAREKQDRVRAYTRLSRRRLRYTLVVHHDETERSLVVTDESLVALRDDGQPLAADTVVPFITSKAGGLSVKLERQSHPRSFALPRQRTVLSEVGDLVNHPHLVAVARELASIRVYYLEPNRMRAEVADVQAHDPGSNGEHRLIASVAEQAGAPVELIARRTKGCHPGNLRGHLRDHPHVDRVLVAVDAGGLDARDRQRCLERIIEDLRPREVTWSTAAPSVEAWLLADLEALHAVLEEEAGRPLKLPPGPPFPKTEARAKQVLDDWITAVVGYPPAAGGREYAEDTARRIDPHRLSPRRFGPLVQLIRASLPRLIAPLPPP